ncbi:MAG: thioether cross-link-forming SCIFF peptide maturase, partial [Clostridia bacterium]|nr:thioether cross-link-forming SCIFF peptide maturase [Clostridia bacterium]
MLLGSRYLLKRRIFLIHAFQFRDLYLILDVESGALHSVDEPAYAVVQALEKGWDVYALPYPERQIREIVQEVEQLRAAGSLCAPEPVPPQGLAQGGIIKSMCLHVAHDCNLRCRYCFADTGEFHGPRGLMPPEVGKKALDFLLAHAGGRKHLEVDLFGGEPLMNMETVRAVVSYGRELEKKHGKQINFTITTNGVGLTDEIIDYLNAEMHNIVLSLDGRPEVHDTMRPTANGKGSYAISLPHMKKLVERRGDKEYYIRGTFTAKNLDFTQDVKHLRNLGFEQLSMEPVVLPDESPYAILEEHVAQVLEEYEKLADYVFESRKKPDTWMNFFHFMVDLSGGPCLKKRIAGCSAGVEYVAVTPEGDIYPCHQFVGQEKMKMGSVLTGELNEDIRRTFQSCTLLD